MPAAADQSDVVALETGNCSSLSIVDTGKLQQFIDLLLPCEIGFQRTKFKISQVLPQPTCRDAGYFPASCSEASCRSHTHLKRMKKKLA